MRLITGATIIDGVRDRPVEGHAILVDGPRIKAIGQQGDIGVPPGADVIDATGTYVIPGLMNANVHLILVSLESIARYGECYEDLIVETAQLALKNGLTTVFDSWGPRVPLMSVRDKIASGEIVGSRIFCAGNIIGLDGPFSLDFNEKALAVASPPTVRRINAMYVENSGPDLTWMTPDQVAQEVGAYIARGVDFIKYASSEHRWKEHEATASLLFSERAQAAMVEEAHRRGVTAQAHTSAVEALRVSVEAGCDLIQHCNITGPVPIPTETSELMAKHRTGGVVFAFTQRRLAWITANCNAQTRRYYSTVDQNTRELIRAGANILLGNDALLQPPQMKDPKAPRSWLDPGEDNICDLAEGHFVWLRAMEEQGFPPMEMLRAATRNIAAAYGKSKDLGTLEPGKIADLLILDKDPLAKADNYRSIRTILKDGLVVDRDALPAHPILLRPLPPADDTVEPYGRFAMSGYPPYPIP